ncbi:MAG: TatD family hydrolase, partial [Patescibacteria group bacterium]
LLETDAPFLTPEPHRGKTCTPAYLPLVAKKVGELWGESVEVVNELTLINTRFLFGKIKKNGRTSC